MRVYKTGCFQAYTQVNGTRRWIDLTGVTPAANTEYTVKLVLNTKRMNYTAAIVNGNTETPLVAADGGATKFAFANQNGAGIEKVRFNGQGFWLPRRGQCHEWADLHFRAYAQQRHPQGRCRAAQRGAVE